MASTDKIEAFVAEPRNIIVAGSAATGAHLSPNWFSWDGQRFYVSTTQTGSNTPSSAGTRGLQLLIDDPPVSAPCWSGPPSRSARISPRSCAPLPCYPGKARNGRAGRR
jgi:hypothetical protein